MTDKNDILRKYMGPLSKFRPEKGYKTRIENFSDKLKELISACGFGEMEKVEEIEDELMEIFSKLVEEYYSTRQYAESKREEAETWRARYTHRELKHNKSEEVLNDYIDSEYEGNDD